MGEEAAPYYTHKHNIRESYMDKPKKNKLNYSQENQQK